MVSPGGCSRGLWKNCWLKDWGLGIGHLGAAGSCVGSSEEGWALFKESQLLGYSPSFSLICSVEVWVEIPGFWLLSIRDVWWAEKQFGSGYKALIFLSFFNQWEAWKSSWSGAPSPSLWSSRIPAGSSHTTATELEKKFTFPAHSYSGTFFRPRIKNPLDWAIKLRLFSRTFVLCSYLFLLSLFSCWKEEKERCGIGFFPFF